MEKNIILPIELSFSYDENTIQEEEAQKEAIAEALGSSPSDSLHITLSKAEALNTAENEVLIQLGENLHKEAEAKLCKAIKQALTGRSSLTLKTPEGVVLNTSPYFAYIRGAKLSSLGGIQLFYDEEWRNDLYCFPYEIANIADLIKLCKKIEEL